MYELSKSQKKIARQVIENGLQREYAQGITKVENLIRKWKSGKSNNRDAYLGIYKTLMKHDKDLGKRYDGMTGSKYLIILVQQLAAGVIKPEDLEPFDEEVKEHIIQVKEFFIR